MTVDPTAHSLSNRIVLLGLTALALDDETPAHAPQVRRCCQDRAADLPDVVAGRFDEATVARSLNELETTDAVVAHEDEQPSAVGKGRPAYDLATDADHVLDALETDDAVAPAINAIRE